MGFLGAARARYFRSMTGPDDREPSLEAIETESLQWVTLLHSGVMTPEAAEAFKLWRAQSHLHEKAFSDAVRMRRHIRDVALADRAAQASNGAKSFPRRGSEFGASRGSDSRPVRNIDRRSFFGATAAAASVAIAVADPGHLWPSWQELTADYRTATGERRALVAGNGVSVELNTQTTADLDTSSSQPHLTVISGEVAINAARPPHAPFAVIAGAGKALFEQANLNIRKTGSGVCVTCVDGEATVFHPTGRIVLTKGLQASYGDQHMEAPVHVDPSVPTAWRRGLLIFRNEPLRDVIVELNRYRQGKIVLMSDALAQRPVYGVFEIARIQEAVDQIRRLTGASATNVGSLVLLT